MTHKRNPLTQEQLDWARKQYAKGEPMRQIAIVLRMRPDWLKCLIDPVFREKRFKARRENDRRRRERRRALTAATGPTPETDMQLLANRRAVKADLAFIAAMTRSIRKGDETAAMVTRKAPSTESPRFVPHRSPGLLSVTGSSSQSCADFA